MGGGSGSGGVERAVKIGKEAQNALLIVYCKVNFNSTHTKKD
jgi:hypothetical protein